MTSIERHTYIVKNWNIAMAGSAPRLREFLAESRTDQIEFFNWFRAEAGDVEFQLRAYPDDI